MRITPAQLCEELRTSLRNIQTDSRLVEQGDVFVALPAAVPGERSKTAAHIRMALEKGAWAVVAPARSVERMNLKTKGDKDHAWLLCEDSRAMLGALAAARFGTEKSDVPVIAVTGTNGKTTCAYLLEHLYKSRGIPVGVMGTISYRWPGHVEAAPLTTPGCLALHRAMKDMRDAGAKAVIMEVSSHAVDQKRIAGINFSAVAFTNLTQDHLDYHKTMENYFQAKRALFADFPLRRKAMVITNDDPYGHRLLEEFPQALGVGIRTPLANRPFLLADVRRADTEGLSLHFYWQKNREERLDWVLHSPLIGLHNANNLCTVCGLALSMGFSVEDLKCLSRFTGVPGRLERIVVPSATWMAGAQTGVFVDYAHTPDALIHVLKTLRAARFARLITVFGCGGDRDRTKRPLMGEAVAEMSDIAIVTSDNPRTEDPEAIIDDIMPGLEKARHVYREADRRKALELAVGLLRPGDALLVAGKGHEDYQIIGTTKHHFSDQEILKELISCR
ncbi:UDP-N-acetylmuramoyl-L-alanyl-D-glutamate--2,6-diaminopimelate ligase [Mailhella massiliensis]|uniref:UDP-N-acetylmuramoyl-L-alanyl-D-glutamate--2, 6-diaminopimelate ligase n=1 Tax=Mailhella massiliensis TaxID=1903261 RepID=UPI002357B073|nr:UDP-N-acetylmuramoyl-L-alanyl-D-glutamate--2,6-diaminopimelate ligase [Mailhella massiliensis]